MPANSNPHMRCSIAATTTTDHDRCQDEVGKVPQRRAGAMTRSPAVASEGNNDLDQRVLNEGSRRQRPRQSARLATATRNDRPYHPAAHGRSRQTGSTATTMATSATTRRRRNPPSCAARRRRATTIVAGAADRVTVRQSRPRTTAASRASSSSGVDRARRRRLSRASGRRPQRAGGWRPSRKTQQQGRQCQLAVVT